MVVLEAKLFCFRQSNHDESCGNHCVPSACEEDRARRLNATLTESILHLIPECEDNGDYAALQCFTSNDWCVCYRRNGENINTPSKTIKACDCIRHQDDAKTAGALFLQYYQFHSCVQELCNSQLTTI
ncbi:venom factor [Trichonephila clavata]|uniref:Venom factor n=1 Tax=Trichonephila clavata TaxID=2740835 RepID=A0A8X6LXQ6_TRICU|nr:venom factor [Trichonephila clavata]